MLFYMPLQERINDLTNLEDTDFILQMIGTEAQIKAGLQKKPRLIGVEGNIGSGKSTLSRFLAARLNMGLFLEKVDDNPLWSGTIEQFYRNPLQYGASVQMALLHMRRIQAQEAQDYLGSAVIDRTYWADQFVFVPSLSEAGLPKSEVEFLNNQYKKFDTQFPSLDLLIILHCNPETAFNRRQKRARGVETGTVADEKFSQDHYLVGLDKKYRALPTRLKESRSYMGPILEINQEEFNIRNLEHQVALLEELGGIFKIPRPLASARNY
jgi:deoxyadenosine/deoxycytidine kinase